MTDLGARRQLGKTSPTARRPPRLSACYGGTIGLELTYELVSGDIEGLYLPFGPLPTESYAGCEPLVEFAPGSVEGSDSTWSLVWSASAFEHSETKTNDPVPVTLLAEQANG